MRQPRQIAAALARTARSRRARLARRAPTADRLVRRPTFVLSSVRSGSTLLRVMLNTHSQIYAPHELHLSGIKVELTSKYPRNAMKELGLDAEALQFLLWDRLLERELSRHGKQWLVNKTPSDAMMWRKILKCWPDAQFIFLLRHPAAVTDSWQRVREEWTRDQVAEDVLPYMVALEEARKSRGGLTVRYEDLTTHPERETRRICEFLDVPWEPEMLNYGQADHGVFRPGLGDWSERILSGQVQAAEPLPPPEQIPPALVDISTKWGYLTSAPVASPVSTPPTEP